MQHSREQQDCRDRNQNKWPCSKAVNCRKKNREQIQKIFLLILIYSRLQTAQGKPAGTQKVHCVCAFPADWISLTAAFTPPPKTRKALALSLLHAEGLWGHQLSCTTKYLNSARGSFTIEFIWKCSCSGQADRARFKMCLFAILTPTQTFDH